MQAQNILSYQPTQGNHPTPPSHFIQFPTVKPVSPKQADQLLAGWSETLRVAGLALLAFRRAVDQGLSREDLETTYNLIIVANGLHVFLTPGDVADIAAAVEAVR